MKKLFAFLVAAGVSLGAAAAPETYVIDNTHTFPRFEYSHFGYSTQVSRFDKTSGKIVLDRAAKSGSVDVVIDATSVNTGFPVFNSHLQGERLEVTSFHCMPHPMLKKDACGANAVTKIKRSEFNAGKYAPYVGDEVTLSIPVEAVKE